MGVWREVTLADIAKTDGYGMVDGPFGSNLPAADYTETGVPVIRGVNLSTGDVRFKDDAFIFVSERTAERLRRSLCVAEDIIFTKKGTLGQVGYIPRSHKYEKFLISSNQLKLSVNKQIADPLFVYYSVSSPSSRAKIVQDSESTGVPKINLSYLRQFPILLPSIDQQRAVARILSSLDDKIELNRRMNATLEAMARALFKAWFVDFEPVHANQEKRTSTSASPEIAALFPSDFKNGLPQGFQAMRLGEVLELIESGSRPKGGIDPNLKDGIPSLGAESVNGLGVYDYSKTKFVTRDFFESMRRGQLRDYDVLIYKDGAYVGRKGMFGRGFPFRESAVNEHVFILRSNEKASQFYLYFELNPEKLAQLNANSAQPGLNQSAMKSFELSLPPHPVLSAFDESVKPLIDKVFENCKEIRTLSELRDSLLPPLISGRIRVGGGLESYAS